MRSNVVIDIFPTSRALEEKIPLQKTHSRLSHQLGRAGLWRNITHSLFRVSCSRGREDTLLIMDLSDIAKRYARKMEYMTRVWDGSEGEVVNGYWTCNVVAAEVGEMVLTPLYSRLFSQNAPDFFSENQKIFRAISMVSKQADKKGIWVLDRGGDTREIMDHLLGEELGFILRSKGKRYLIYRGSKNSVYDLALGCALPYMEKSG